jgi:hypothetical protein
MFTVQKQTPRTPQGTTRALFAGLDIGNASVKEMHSIQMLCCNQTCYKHCHRIELYLINNCTKIKSVVNVLTELPSQFCILTKFKFNSEENRIENTCDSSPKLAMLHQYCRSNESVNINEISFDPIKGKVNTSKPQEKKDTFEAKISRSSLPLHRCRTY